MRMERMPFQRAVPMPAYTGSQPPEFTPGPPAPAGGSMAHGSGVEGNRLQQGAHRGTPTYTAIFSSLLELAGDVRRHAFERISLLLRSSGVDRLLGCIT